MHGHIGRIQPDVPVHTAKRAKAAAGADSLRSSGYRIELKHLRDGEEVSSLLLNDFVRDRMSQYLVRIA